MNIEDAADICHPLKSASNPGRELLGDILGARRRELDRVRGLGWTDALRDLETGHINARAYLACTVSAEGLKEDLMKARAACVRLLLMLEDAPESTLAHSKPSAGAAHNGGEL